MNKIYCNKETNMVEQILKVKSSDELPDEYFDNCYAVIDELDKVNAYNLRYNNETKDFEVIVDIPAFDEVVVENSPTKEDYDNLKKENEDLKKENEDVKNRLDKLESLIAKMSEVK